MWTVLNGNEAQETRRGQEERASLVFLSDRCREIRGVARQHNEVCVSARNACCTFGICSQQWVLRPGRTNAAVVTAAPSLAPPQQTHP